MMKSLQNKQWPLCRFKKIVKARKLLRGFERAQPEAGVLKKLAKV
jgi:hypothetical protein